MRILILTSLAGCFSAVACGTIALADDSGLATTLHDVVRKGNRLCLASHEHSGTSQGQPTKKRALAAAIDSWAGFTAWEYGTDWGYWKLAHRKVVRCGGRPGYFSCDISASPCRLQSRRRRR